MIPDEKEWSYLRITGYDAQNREIWSLNCKRPFGVSSSERKVYSGSKNDMVFHNLRRKNGFLHRV